MGLSATAVFRPRSDLGRFVEAVVTPAVVASVEASCQLIENRAKEFCPVDTGALRDSITHEIDSPSGLTIVGRVGPHTDYAAYVEYGTGARGAASQFAGKGPYTMSWPGMAPQPYMRPAVDESREPIMDLFRSNILTAL